MAQSFPTINATDFISASRQNILDRDAALQSNFSGSSFPTVGVVVGQSCWRTDLQKMYVLETAAPDVWREIVKSTNLGTAAFKNTGTSGDALPLLNVANTFSAEQLFSAGIDFDTAIIGGLAGEIQANTDLRLNAYTAKDINFMINSASKMKLYADGGVTVGAPTGNSKGNATLNAQALYVNGTQVGTAATKNTGVSSGLIPLYENFGALAFLANVNTAQLVDDAVTLAKMAHLTAGGIISYNPSGNTPQLILPGDDGQVLTAQGTGQMPVWADASGLVKIDELDATSVSVTSVGFDLPWADYYDFQIRFRKTRMDAIAANTQGALMLKPSIDGGSSFVPAARMAGKAFDSDFSGTGSENNVGLAGAYPEIIDDGKLPGDQYTFTNAADYPGAWGTIDILGDDEMFLAQFDTMTFIPTAAYTGAYTRRRGQIAILATNSTTFATIGDVDHVQLFAELVSTATARNIFGYFELWGRKR